MRYAVPIVDLFAGPGGLGEGFAAFRAEGHHRATFKIAVSVEMDPHAHQTLELRSFFRQFVNAPPPTDYYRYLREEGFTREMLFAAWPRQARAAQKEARLATLGGNNNPQIYHWIEKALAHRPLHWVLIGGPPCQAYSLAGRSRRRADPNFKTDTKHTLYLEYLRIIARFRPSVFVMENVKGLLSSKLNDEPMFERIMKDLKHPEMALQKPLENETRGDAPVTETLTYQIFSLVVPTDNPDSLRPTDFVIRAEEFGIPQARHRVILLGIRSDIAMIPGTIPRHGTPIPVCSVLSDLPPLRSSLSNKKKEGLEDNEANWRASIREILDRDWFQDIENGQHRQRVDTRNQLDLFIENTGRWEQMAATIRTSIEGIQEGLSAGGRYMPGTFCPNYRGDWYHDAALEGVCNHNARSHMVEDLHRYLYTSCYARVYGVSPKMRDFPADLLPAHKNIEKAREQGEEEDFNDRFRVQVTDRPATTITSHISKDGHYNIHFDPGQCRSLTVREAARLQTFPDNYFFEGPRTEQYLQVGNAVPPLLANQIAKVVYDLFEKLDAPRRRRNNRIPEDTTPLVGN